MKEADLSDKDVRVIDGFLSTLSLLKVCIDERRKVEHCLSLKHALCLESDNTIRPWDDRYWVIEHVNYDLDYSFVELCD